MVSMPADPQNEEALRRLDEAHAEPVPTGPVELSRFYLAAVDWLESLPQNETGADKTWVERAQAEFARYYERVREAQ
jgi:hypothetical protein